MNKKLTGCAVSTTVEVALVKTHFKLSRRVRFIGHTLKVNEFTSPVRL